MPLVLFRAVVSGLALATAVPAIASAASPAGLVSEAPATQMATIQYVFHSARTGRDYLIKVTSPFSPVPSGAKLPVVYALDGGYEVAGPIAWIVGGAGGMRQAFVVSVGYLPKDYRWREVDLAFRAYRDEDGGRSIESGAPAFRSFLNEELRPFLAGRLPIDDRQAILFGHSEGGLFAANILADRPQEYAGYVIASPAVWSDPSILGRLRTSVPKIRRVRVYLSIAGDETPAMKEGVRDLASILATADQSVGVKTQTFEGGTHLSYYPTLVSVALPWMLGS